MLRVEISIREFLRPLGFKIRSNLVICWIGLCLIFLTVASVVDGPD